MGDYVLIITLTDGNETKQVLLNSQYGYSFEGYSSPIYQILDSKNILADLLNIIDTTETPFLQKK